jgi:hypothetical protein
MQPSRTLDGVTGRVSIGGVDADDDFAGLQAAQGYTLTKWSPDIGETAVHLGAVKNLTFVIQVSRPWRERLFTRLDGRWRPTVAWKRMKFPPDPT